SLHSILAKDKDFAMIPCNIADFWAVGVMAVGNNNALVLPYTTLETELQLITDLMNPSVKVYRMDESLTGVTCLSNALMCNDSVGIANPSLSAEARKQLQDWLGLKKIYITSLENYPLPGTFFGFNNFGMLVPHDVSDEQVAALAAQVNLPVAKGTCASGSADLGRHFVVNSEILLSSPKTTPIELRHAQRIFNIKDFHWRKNLVVNENDGTIVEEEFEDIDHALLDSIL
ncbi:MAG: Eukaryotic translation initiation factor 6, partial [Paramarteilia canceri]